MFYQDLWFWLFVVAALAALGSIVAWLKIPLPDRYNVGFFFATETERWRFMEALAIMGLFPDKHTPKSPINRIIYFKRDLKLILDLAPPEKMTAMGHPHGFIARRTNQPAGLTNALAAFLDSKGEMTTIDHNPDPTLDKGLLSAVSAPQAFPYMLVTREFVGKLKGAEPFPASEKQKLRKIHENYGQGF